MKKQYIYTTAVLLFGTLCFVSDAFALKADGVKSRHIAEADGITGQDTNRGSGVKTGHIQDSAVTDAKINDLSMEKVTGLQAALDSKADASLGNMTVVATSGGAYTDPLSAMNDLANWCGVPSASNPCVIKIMPGVYDLSAPVTLVPHIDLIGSGSSNTSITANGFNAVEGDSAGVTIADLNIASDLYAIYLDTASTADGLTLKNVTATSDSRGAVYIQNNDTRITVDSCKLTGRDGPLGFRGTHSTNTLEVEIHDTEFFTNNTNYLPESAVFGTNAHSLTLNDDKIVGYLENFQVSRIDEIRVNRLDGVAYFNFPSSVDVTVRDSRLSNPLGGAVPIVWGTPAYGPIKLVNTMLVGGTDVSAAAATLLNCFDENLQTVTSIP